MICKKILIEGRVQGVGFRYSTKKRARGLGVKGYIKNLPNGKVEAVFYGEEEKVNKMLDFCKQGPRLARISDFYIEDCNKEFDSFEVRY